MHGYLKPVLFTEDSIILQEGEPVVMMVFIMKGKLVATSCGDITPYKVVLKAGDFYGEEIIPWAMEDHLIPLPISTRKIKCQTKVEAFALEANQLRSVVSQFHIERPPNKQSMRLYSREWRVWAANTIQEAWREYCQRKQKTGGRFRDTLAKTVGTSANSGVNLYASVFISHLLQAVQQDRCHGTTQHSQVMTLLPPPKPDKPDKQDDIILNL